MLIKQLEGVRVVLGSQSPRRKELLASLGIDFQVIVRETAEDFDPDQSADDIVRSIALNKLEAFQDETFFDSLVITADTVVVDQGQILGKPKDNTEAIATLLRLQEKEHDVLTAVALGYHGKVYSFVERTGVSFYPLQENEIIHYVESFLPLDKAGSYGIQEWIGLIAVKALQGSYENVVGLPTARLYQELKAIISAV